ncbi:PH domain-containing protein [Micromonospora musae]|uniref:PH domain-containing protein n=1 Tax=Micromonospora musae TaxID=1894970 RepID=UPI003409AE12
MLITLLLGLPGISLARWIVPEGDLPLTFKAGMLVLIGTVYLAVIWFWRAATIVYQDHIAVRQLFRTRRTAWSDVSSIEIENNPASSRTMLLDREGRLFALPGGVGAQAHEVRVIKDIWERRRGEGWTPPAEGAVLAAQHWARSRESAIVWAVFLTVGSFLALLVSGLILNSRSDWDNGEIPWLFQVIGFVPVVVFIAVYQAAVRLLRRRHLLRLDKVAGDSLS